jgi:hypothetical protein
MTGHQAQRPATPIYLRLNLAREQRALIRAPARALSSSGTAPARLPQHRGLCRAAGHLNPR